MGLPPQQNAAVAKAEDSPSPDFESQLSDLTGELDSQFSIAKGKVAPPPPSDSTLIKNPPHIEAVRRRLFALDILIVWSEAEWNMYFPYVNNFWVYNQGRDPTRKGTVAEYWYCRFWRGAVESAGTKKRSKKIRDVPKCRCTMKVLKQLNVTGGVESMTLSLGRKDQQHNHDQEFADRTKLNDGVNKPLQAEVEKGYGPAEVHRNAQGTHRDANAVALKAAGGSALTLQGVYNAGKDYLRHNKDPRIQGARDDWKQQMTDCYEFLQGQGEEVLSEIVTAKRLIDEEVSHAVVYAYRDHLRMLLRRGHLFLMDSTHNTNTLKWKLFTVMVRDEYGRYWLCAHMLSSNEDGDIIAAFLRCLLQWCRGTWHPRYAITDDSAAEQRAVRLAFRGLRVGEQKVSHFLCRTHSERTLNRKLAGDKCKKSKEHLYRALYFRKTRGGAEDSVNEALAAAPDDATHKYIKDNWYATLPMWANYARQHSCILLQCMTTNIVESWHHSLKTHGGGKATILTFSLSGIAKHTLAIGSQWRERALTAATKFRTTKLPECIEHPGLALFPGPVQELLVDELKQAIIANWNGEEPPPLGDDIVCTVPNGCLFWRKYQLPCKHIWQIHVSVDVITMEHWTRFAWMFDDGGFEIYESTTREYVVRDMDDAIGRPDKHLLEVREVLDSIKDRYYEIVEYMERNAPDERYAFIQGWVDKLRLLTGPIRQQGVEQAINEIALEDGELTDGEVIPRRRRRRRYEVDSEDEG